MMHDFANNPAIAGTDDFLKAQLNKRYQFLGIPDAPNTTSFSAHGDLEALSMGWGTIIYKDAHGPFEKFGAYGAYAYRIAIDPRTDLSFGTSIGLISYKIDGTSLVGIQPEPFLDLDKYSFIRPDATAGVYLKSKDYYAGISVDQLFNNKIELIQDTAIGNTVINRLRSHYCIMGGYTYRLSYGFTFEPNLLVRKTAFAPLQAEISGRVVYDKTVWAGMSFRTGDAVTLLLGYYYDRKLYFAYAYDITYSRLRKDSYGSHEILLGIRFPESIF